MSEHVSNDRCICSYEVDGRRMHPQCPEHGLSSSQLAERAVTATTGQEQMT